jgi:hypothetical protein
VELGLGSMDSEAQLFGDEDIVGRARGNQEAMGGETGVGDIDRRTRQRMRGSEMDWDAGSRVGHGERLRRGARTWIGRRIPIRHSVQRGGVERSVTGGSAEGERVGSKMSRTSIRWEWRGLKIP